MAEERKVENHETHLATRVLPLMLSLARLFIQTLEDMLRVCVIDFKGNWDDHLPLIEFAYINSYHSSMGMALFEALYGKRCRSPIGWLVVGEVSLIWSELISEAIEKVQIIRQRLRTTQSRQKSYAIVGRKDLEIDVHDLDYLKISPMKVVKRFGKKRKLSSRFVGPYKILRCVGKRDEGIIPSPTEKPDVSALPSTSSGPATSTPLVPNMASLTLKGSHISP
ncbi:hypothetical protein MTR67_034764 [Solanum verrucosum]|uniref:Uncharacterized protein n=1 Tax=Solanum verrucosum TaxID=315347 RepID=A0AAF0U8Y2_SOLVR|nr:hypothetical protein MTR67_034764 [Solanum verrucosum]